MQKATIYQEARVVNYEFNIKTQLSISCLSWYIYLLYYTYMEDKREHFRERIYT